MGNRDGQVRTAPLVEVDGLTGARLEAIAAIWKRERRQLVARFSGSSMEPTIPAGAEVLLQCGVVPAVGEIALVIFGDHIVVHRVIARPSTPGAWVLTRGDASALPDKATPEEAVIGIIRRVKLGARFVEPSLPPTSLGRRLALATCLLGLRVTLPTGQRLIGGLWSVRRWLVLAPRAAVRRGRSVLARLGH